MTMAFNVQTTGSVVVVGGFAGAEICAAYLDKNPGSPWAWFLNIEIFRPFELARGEASPLRFLFGPASLDWAIAVLVAILLFRAVRFRFGIALLSNLAFIGSTALAYSWATAFSGPRSASLIAASFRPHIDGMLVYLLLGASSLAFALSHFSFIAAIHARRRPPIEGTVG